jgi:hypothetical protein
MELGDFIYFQFFFILLNLEYTRTFISTVGILSNEKVNSLKIPQELLVAMEIFVPFFSASSFEYVPLIPYH